MSRANEEIKSGKSTCTLPCIFLVIYRAKPATEESAVRFRGAHGSLQKRDILVSHSGFCYFRERGDCRVQLEKAVAFSSGFSLRLCREEPSCSSLHFLAHLEAYVSYFQPPEGILSSGADFFLLILCG